MAKIPIKILCLIFFTIGLFLGAESRAAQVHGILTVVKGNVSIKSGKTGKDEKAKIGMKVFPKDSILTQADSRAKIVMVDKNEINVSPSSNIVIDSYEFDPAKDNKKVLIDVIYGKVRAKVEQKYDGETNKFQVKTPSAVAGVRGTDFFTSFNQVTNSSKVVTFKGEVAFGLPGPGGTILNPVSVKIGEFTVNTGNNPPAPAVQMPKSELAQFDKETKADTPDRDKQGGPGGGSNQPEKDKKDEGGNKGQDSDQKKDEGGNKGQGSDQKKDEGGNKGQDSDQKKDEGGNKGQGNNKEGRGNDGARTEQGEKGSEQSKNEPGSNPNNGSGSGARTSDARPDGTAGGPSGSGPGSGPEFAGGPPTPGMGGDPKRDPAGMMPMPMEGTGMMRPEDFASAPNMPAFVGMMPPPPMMPFLPPPMPGTNIICEFCREVIQDGATRLFIRVTQGSQ